MSFNSITLWLGIVVVILTAVAAVITLYPTIRDAVNKESTEKTTSEQKDIEE